MSRRRVLLVDPDEGSRHTLADRLGRQGFVVAEATDGVEGAIAALGEPPDAVVADLWMPSISGVQLCRLLKAEPATADVPIILRGPDDQRNRFWAERAGATAYVVKGRMSDLVRGLDRAIAQRPAPDDFFTALSTRSDDIRDRIASHLDAALFDSVIAAEVRQLATCEGFERLFDLFSQFVSQVTAYRWLAVTTASPQRMGVHSCESARVPALVEVRRAMHIDADTEALYIGDDDAVWSETGPPPMVLSIAFGDLEMGQLALAPVVERAEDRRLVEVLAHELGGALRMATLVEESRRLATIDALTGLRNRRAFVESAEHTLARCARFDEKASMLLLDIDHFKLINDKRGHASGDLALAAVGRRLVDVLRLVDVPARWGGEEFVVALPGTGTDGARICGERVRAAIEGLELVDTHGEPMRVTASVGVTSFRAGDDLHEMVDRADRAMYVAKSEGRNRVVVDEEEPSGIVQVPAEAIADLDALAQPSALEGASRTAPGGRIAN